MQGSRRVPLESAHPARTFWIAALAVLLIDQVSKYAVRATLTPGESIKLIEDVFHLTYVRNVGAAFGLFPGRQPFFIATSLLVLFAVAVFWRRAKPTAWPIALALGLIAGGAFGNLIDRAWLGKVTDFFYFVPIDFPVFNVADMGIVIGVGILMVWLLFGPEEIASPDSAEQLEAAEPATESATQPTPDDREADS